MAAIENGKFLSGPPSIDEKNIILWLFRMRNYLRGTEQAHLAIDQEKPVLNQEALNALLNPNGNETPRSKEFQKAHDDAVKLWTERNDIAWGKISVAIGNSPTALQIAISCPNTDTAKDLLDRLRNRFHVVDNNIIQAAISDFNSMKILNGEQGQSFVNRLVEKKMILASYGREIEDDIDLLGRLLDGLMDSERYKLHALSLKAAIGMTWTRAAQEIISFDTRNPMLVSNDAVAVAGTSLVTSSNGPKYETAQLGHENKNRHRSNGKYSQRRDDNYHQGRKRQREDSDSERCEFCFRTNHNSSKCFYKDKEIQRMESILSKFKGKNKTDQHNSSRKRYEDKDDESEISM